MLKADLFDDWGSALNVRIMETPRSTLSRAGLARLSVRSLAVLREVSWSY
jgi:hypothetical protein